MKSELKNKKININFKINYLKDCNQSIYDDDK